jgi:hypothetical protein
LLRLGGGSVLSRGGHDGRGLESRKRQDRLKTIVSVREDAQLRATEISRCEKSKLWSFFFSWKLWMSVALNDLELEKELLHNG